MPKTIYVGHGVELWMDGDFIYIDPDKTDPYAPFSKVPTREFLADIRDFLAEIDNQ